MSNLFSSGIRPAIDEYLLNKGAEIRDYGEFWSASSAGYCQRKVIFERLGVPPVEKDSDARRTRVFEAGHVFHSFVQGITKNAGLSVAQELQLQDEDLMVRGHIDDLILKDGKLMLMDYKTQNSGAFTWQKGKPANAYHRLQVGTYMYMIRRSKQFFNHGTASIEETDRLTGNLEEARILKISKDDLRMDENQILWDEKLEKDVLNYWTTLNKYWAERKIPPCSCHVLENGFMAKERFNPYFYEGEPCSIKYLNEMKEQGKVKGLIKDV